MRVKLFYAGMAAFFLLLGLYLFFIQVVQGGRFRKMSDDNCIRLIEQPGARGDILDRNGASLVTSAISYNVVILPQDAGQIDALLSRLSRTLGADPALLRKNFRRNYRTPSIPVTVLEDIDRDKALMLEEVKFDLEGVIVQSLPRRWYPFGRLGCHLFGYLSQIDVWRLMKLEDFGYQTRDIVGNGGIEEKYDYYLRQEDGGLSVVVDHRGRFVRLLGFRAPRKGKDVQLTIDWRMQKVCEDALEGTRGAVVLMEAASGEVLAMASAPAFDPAAFLEKKRGALDEILRDKNHPLFNRAISASLPPGSVFKLVAVTAGLERAKLTPQTTIPCKGFLRVGNRDFKCWGTHGDQDLIQAIAHSCDVFFYKAGLAIGAQSLHDYALRLGLARPTGIELPYEASGFVPNPLWKRLKTFQPWYDGDTANLVIGQGETLTTPLQICRMMAVFANGGQLVRPYLVRAVDGRQVWQQHRKVIPLGLKKETLKAARLGLREVVAERQGTASMLDDAPVAIAGKTGTAEIDKIEAHAWFAGFFPYPDSKYAICVIIERGGHGYAASMMSERIITALSQEGLL